MEGKSADRDNDPEKPDAAENAAARQERRLAEAKKKSAAAVKSALLSYVWCTLGGIVLGGFGAGLAAAWFDAGALLVSGAVVLGLVLGGVTGFFCGQLVVAVMVEEMIFDAGVKATGLGYKGAKGLWRKLRSKNPEE